MLRDPLQVFFDASFPAQRKKLAGFVLEQLPVMRQLVGDAQARLARLTNGDRSFCAYDHQQDRHARARLEASLA